MKEIHELRIQHEDILAKVTGMSQLAIWEALLYFLLYGRPSHSNRRQYCLYYCWQAIQLAITYSHQERAGEIKSYQWPTNESLAAKVLGWETHTVMTQFENYQSGERTINAMVAFQVVRTISEFRAWHQAYVQEILTGLPADDLQPNTWVWYLDKEVPAFLLDINAPRNRPPGTPAYRYEIMVPKDDMPAIVNSHTRLKYFNVTYVQRYQLAKLRPDVDELQY